MPTYFLTLQGHFTPWDLPTVPTVIHSIRAKYPGDPKLIVVPDRNSHGALYKIVMDNDSTKSGEALEIPLNVQGSEVMFPLVIGETDFSKNNSMRGVSTPGVLYTFYASALGTMEPLPNEAFDEAMRQYGHVTRPTEHQNIGEWRFTTEIDFASCRQKRISQTE